MIFAFARAYIYGYFDRKLIHGHHKKIKKKQIMIFLMTFFWILFWLLFKKRKINIGVIRHCLFNQSPAYISGADCGAECPRIFNFGPRRSASTVPLCPLQNKDPFFFFKIWFCGKTIFWATTKSNCQKSFMIFTFTEQRAFFW